MGKTDNSAQQASPGGMSGKHPPLNAQPMVVAPSTTDEFNLIVPPLTPIACWRVDDVRFNFDSSLILPDVATELPLLAELRQQHKSKNLLPPISIYGHADPVGAADYNKTLSGRRTLAVVGLLTRNPDPWEKLYSNPLGSDRWGLASVQTMLTAVGYTPGASNGVMGDQTRSAVKAFQQDNALPADGQPGPGTRKLLFTAYMDKICKEALGATYPFTLANDFLAKGADADGRGDYHGCGKSNPARIFSLSEEAGYEQAQDKSERNAQNAPNRRVMIFLFQPGTTITPSKWPCPSVKGPIGECEKRFWANAKTRLANQPLRREFNDTHDTFGCRFYDRMTRHSPCEHAMPAALLGYLSVQIFFHREPIANQEVVFSEAGDDGQAGQALGDTLITDANGVAKLGKPVPTGNYLCQIKFQPDMMICTVESVDNPYVLVLPLGRPYVDFGGDVEFNTNIATT